MDFIANRKLATGAVILAGGLSLYGCGGPNYRQDKNSDAPSISYNKITIPSPDGLTVTESCDGHNLRVEGGGITDVYLNDPACRDQVFDIQDIQAK